jgi:hypothetical protein
MAKNRSVQVAGNTMGVFSFSFWLLACASFHFESLGIAQTERKLIALLTLALALAFGAAFLSSKKWFLLLLMPIAVYISLLTTTCG